MQLVIGNKNYSTWSLRPWLLMHAFGLDFEEISVSLRSEQLSERLSEFSATARVPVLIDGDLTVWDSLAICEFVNDQYLDGQGWPSDAHHRAIARAICAEMHAGFTALRNEMPMNCRAKRKVELSNAAKADVQRVDDIWSGFSATDSVATDSAATDFAASDRGGELRLFGQFSIADCFYAPVVMRFKTYGIELSEQADRYYQSMLTHPSLQQWVAAALQETEIVEEDEAGIDIS